MYRCVCVPNESVSSGTPSLFPAEIFSADKSEYISSTVSIFLPLPVVFFYQKDMAGKRRFF